MDELNNDLVDGYLVSGKKPICYKLDKNLGFAAIEFFGILAFPLPNDSQQRDRFCLAAKAGMKKVAGGDFSNDEIDLLSKGRLTEIGKIENACGYVEKRIVKRLRHSTVLFAYLHQRYKGTNRKFLTVLNEVMSNYLSEQAQVQMSLNNSNLRREYMKSYPVTHYALAYWVVLKRMGMNPSDLGQALLHPDWLPIVLLSGKENLAMEYKAYDFEGVGKGNALTEFKFDKKVLIVSN